MQPRQPIVGPSVIGIDSQRLFQLGDCLSVRATFLQSPRQRKMRTCIGGWQAKSSAQGGHHSVVASVLPSCPEAFLLWEMPPIPCRQLEPNLPIAGDADNGSF